MAYEKYNWVDGEVITAQKLNHIEGGVEDNSGGAKVKYLDFYYDYSTDPDAITTDYTRDDVGDLLTDGYSVIARLHAKDQYAPYAMDFYLPLINADNSGQGSSCFFESVYMEVNSSTGSVIVQTRHIIYDQSTNNWSYKFARTTIS